MTDFGYDAGEIMRQNKEFVRTQCAILREMAEWFEKRDDYRWSSLSRIMYAFSGLFNVKFERFEKKKFYNGKTASECVSYAMALTDNIVSSQMAVDEYNGIKDEASADAITATVKRLVLAICNFFPDYYNVERKWKVFSNDGTYCEMEYVSSEQMKAQFRGILLQISEREKIDKNWTVITPDYTALIVICILCFVVAIVCCFIK